MPETQVVMVLFKYPLHQPDGSVEIREASKCPSPWTPP